MRPTRDLHRRTRSPMRRARVRRRRRRALSSNHDRVRRAAAAQQRRRARRRPRAACGSRASRGSTCSRGRFEVVARAARDSPSARRPSRADFGPAERVPRAVHRRRVEQPNVRRRDHEVERWEPDDRLDDLAPAAHPRRELLQAERHVGAERAPRRDRRRAAERARRHRGRRRPTRRRAPRRPGCPCATRRPHASRRRTRSGAQRRGSCRRRDTPAANAPVTAMRVARRRGRARARRAARSPTR